MYGSEPRRRRLERRLKRQRPLRPHLPLVDLVAGSDVELIEGRHRRRSRCQPSPLRFADDASDLALPDRTTCTPSSVATYRLPSVSTVMPSGVAAGSPFLQVQMIERLLVGERSVGSRCGTSRRTAPRRRQRMPASDRATGRSRLALRLPVSTTRFSPFARHEPHLLVRRDRSRRWCRRARRRGRRDRCRRRAPPRAPLLPVDEPPGGSSDGVEPSVRAKLQVARATRLLLEHCNRAVERRRGIRDSLGHQRRTLRPAGSPRRLGEPVALAHGLPALAWLQDVRSRPAASTRRQA